MREQKQEASERASRAEAERDALNSQLQRAVQSLREAESAREADASEYDKRLESALHDCRSSRCFSIPMQCIALLCFALPVQCTGFLLATDL
jgi:transcription initiation factor TFIIIB Brf1 subunit/transcription initiation factor TFIIB